MTKYRYTIDQLQNAVKDSLSIAQVLKTLGMDVSGGNYKTIHKLIRTHRLDKSHFTGQIWNKGKSFPKKRPIEDYLSNLHFMNSHALKLRLIKEGIFEHKCSKCQNTEWFGDPIPLQLDHIDGNNQDNTLANLRLLCPNCHAQTDTYCGKNIGKIGARQRI